MDHAGLHSRIATEVGSSQLATWIIEEAKYGSVGQDWQSSALSMSHRYQLGEPIQYIFGHWSFRSIELLCDGRALIPRPETEQLVEVIIDQIRNNTPSGEIRILEIGTGTGAIAISLAVELANLSIVATDISAAAIELASANLSMQAELKSTVLFIQSDLYGALSFHPYFDYIVSNPPYIPLGSSLESRVVDHEPHQALFGGVDGLQLIEPIIAGAPRLLRGRGSKVILEIDESHGEQVIQIAEDNGFSGRDIIKDFPGKDRFASLRY